MPAVTLAIETSQQSGGIALRDRDGALHIEMLAAARRHDDDLLPAIDRLFSKTGCAPAHLHAVGVSIGPGGFTGLRIAISTVKMFAQTLHAKIAAVPSALVVAESHAGEGPIIVCLAVKGDSCWITRLHRNANGIWHIAGSPELADAAMVDLRGLRTLIGDEHLPELLATRCKKEGIVIERPVFDPAACLRITERMIHAGQITDALALLPLYPRQPEAVTLWDQKLKQSH